MILVKASLRILVRNLLETIILIILISAIVLSHGTIAVLKENLSEQVYMQTKRSMGHVLVTGLFSNNIVESLAGVEGVSDVKLYPVWRGVADVGGDRVILPLVGKSAAKSLVVFDVYQGRMPESENEAVFYHSLSSAPGLRVPAVGVGDNITIVVDAFGYSKLLNLTIVGVARGYAYLGGAPYSLVVEDSLVLNTTGGRYTMLSVVGSDDSPEHIDKLAREVRSVLDASDATVFSFFVNKKENNPVVAIFEGSLGMLETLSKASLALAAVIPVAVGAAQVTREARTVAVMKSVGVGLGGLAAVYSLPWILRGLVGGAIGALLVPPTAKILLIKVVIGDNRIAETIFQYTPFEPYWLETARSALSAVMVVLLASTIPALLAYSIDESKALRFVGLRGGARIRIPAPTLQMAIHVRGVLSRPWRTAGIILALTTLIAVVGAQASLLDGIDNAIEYYEHESKVDLYILATSAHTIESTPLWRRLDETVPPEAVSYAIYDRLDIVNALGMGERFRFKTLLAGDPSLSMPLLQGRYPDKGEVVVTNSLAKLLGKTIGDRLTIRPPTGGELALTIVGVAHSMENNGFIILVHNSDFTQLAGRDPGMLSGILEIDLPDNAPHEIIGKSIIVKLEKDPLVNADIMTRRDITESISGLARILQGVLAAVAATTAILAVIVAAGIIFVDIETRGKEIAVLQAIGLAPLQISLGAAVELTISTIISYIIAQPITRILAESIARTIAPAIGYFEPATSIRTLIHHKFTSIILLAIIISYILSLIRISRLNTSGLLRDT